MKRTLTLAAFAALLLGAVQVQAQSIIWDFEDGTDQGFGNAFSDDASAAFPIVNIGGSLRMEVLRDGGFQEAEHAGSGAAFLAAFNAATANPSGYLISYDWYVDTSLSPGNYGTFLQIGTYINSGNDPFPYVQDFPGSGKDVDLSGTDLASGQVFSGTVTETLTAKYGTLDAAFQSMGFARLGLILNGDGTAATVYFDNITITPVPEPSSLALLGLSVPALWMAHRRRNRR